MPGKIMENIKYKGKYRIPSNRLQGYDYGANGCYFVTICTKNRQHHHHHQRHHPIGEIAEQYWLDIPNHFQCVILDEFVIMPNNIHGILFFDKSVETDNYPSLHGTSAKFGKQSQNLGSVIRAFKSSLKRYANENNIDFAWQERFYDRIIRNNDALENVRAYIYNNPVNWKNDELNDNTPVETDNYPSLHPRQQHTIHHVETDNYPSLQHHHFKSNNS
jgi:REP element-mobilizing transposase RayT